MRRAMLQKIDDSNFFVCDLVSGFVHAYSQARKLRNAYANDILEVRRSSDNTSSNIGSTANEINETDLLAWTGAGNGFVRTLYDQVGVRNISQTSNNLFQPQIVSGGTVIKVSGKPYAQYDGSNDFLITSSATPITDDNCTVFVVFESQSGTSIQDVFNEHTGNVNEFTRINSDTRASDFRHSTVNYDNTSNTLLQFASQQPQATKRCFVFKKTGTTIDVYDESGALIDTNTIASTFSINTLLILGRLNNPSPVNYFGGKIAELLINNTALSSGDQTLVLNNIKAFYGI